MVNVDKFDIPDWDPYVLLDHPENLQFTGEPNDEELLDDYQEADRTIQPSSTPSHVFPSLQEPSFLNSLTTPDEYYLHPGALPRAANTLGLAPASSRHVSDPQSIAHYSPTAIAGASGGDQFPASFNIAALLLGGNMPGHLQSAGSGTSSLAISAVKLECHLSTPTHTVSYLYLLFGMLY
jgi:hypothetical protein